ncbi:arsenate reductase family protein [Streptococcus macacae]|uniref:Transcriptional regulator, Spx/MgsR family n=1 Tax=Streptococcus macacae NCTC 11558 TaxID=764298 RepID=G5JYE9_9STRE|nr:arsenate reductase family protein [Streptococcus macacae]EHJ51756.1 transcriptional regulator, Spx/MgsR family [Streptococcus macacae NCTC 11558]SUN78062.1 Spx/MgsR family transcriptional regulator [Streptococcus macacae NCTC 11558]
MLTFYEYPKCTTCRRAKNDLEKLGLDFERIDIQKKPPKAKQLREWMEHSNFTIKNFFNTSGQSYRSLKLKDKIDHLTIDEASNLLASDGMLIKRPLLVQDGKLLQIGYRKTYADLDL